LLIEGIASTADGRPIEFGRTFVRGDRSRYYVERVVVRPSPHPGVERLANEDTDEEERIDEAIGQPALP
jgi:hypothetical protein